MTLITLSVVVGRMMERKSRTEGGHPIAASRD